MNIDMVLIVIFGILGAGTVLVVFGSIVKNRWGVNLDAVSCPRCDSPLPRVRDPQNARQALWGGWTCVECGCEVDQWGREVNRRSRDDVPSGVRTEEQVLRVVKRMLIVFPAAGYFFLTVLFGWLGIRDQPSTSSEWLAFAGGAAVETVIFTVLFYVASTYLLNRFLLKKRESSAAPGEGHE